MQISVTLACGCAISLGCTLAVADSCFAQLRWSSLKPNPNSYNDATSFPLVLFLLSFFVSFYVLAFHMILY
jgi:hypothetical protein